MNRSPMFFAYRDFLATLGDNIMNVVDNMLYLYIHTYIYILGPQNTVFSWSKGFARKKWSYGQIRFPLLSFQYFIDKIRVLYGQIRATLANDRKKQPFG